MARISKSFSDMVTNYLRQCGFSDEAEVEVINDPTDPDDGNVIFTAEDFHHLEELAKWLTNEKGFCVLSFEEHPLDKNKHRMMMGNRPLQPADVDNVVLNCGDYITLLEAIEDWSPNLLDYEDDESPVYGSEQDGFKVVIRRKRRAAPAHADSKADDVSHPA